MARPISCCRICGNTNLECILSLGEQALTGIFPRSRDEKISVGPLELVKCHGDNACGLVQLRHSFDLNEMYGQNYGYRSGLNASMVRHLKAKAEGLQSRNPPAPGEIVLDIGSNDGTSLSFYPSSATRVGMDPTSAKFRQYYQPGITAIADFFSADTFRSHFGDRKAKIVSSIAMFYDLDAPMKFVEQVAAVLADDGIWHFEQSYMPLMLTQNAYDTVCHEHLEYYGLHQIKWMIDRCGLRILDVELNDINGGSFAVTVCKQDAPHVSDTAAIESILSEERTSGLDTLAPYEEFKRRVFAHRDALCETLRGLIAQGASILGYGASTKGNVILQFCGLTEREIPAIAEVNPDKFGAFTPGTKIPIISEADAHARTPDYLLVMPWHFKANLVEREAPFLQRGGKMIFPLPEIEIVGQ
jgi:hypothetical protein